MSDAIDVSDKTKFAMPIRNLISLIASVGVGVWAYFGIIERLNRIETNNILMQADLIKNTEFRIKWPRGELGSPPADAEQFMLIEHIAGQLEKIQDRMEEMLNNGVNIKRLQEDVKDLRVDVEKLKDGQRTLKHQNGNQ